MSLWGRRPFLAVRILGTDGYYPGSSLRSATHQYGADDRVVWTAVVQEPLPEDWETSENPTLIPEEIRLNAALAFSEADPWHGGMPTVTIGSTRWEKEVEDDFDLESESGAALIHAALARLQEQMPSQSRFRLGDVGNAGDALALLQNFDSTDELLLAGVGNFHAGSRLMSSRILELEAAALCLFVSMGAALEFIRLHLNESRGSANISFAEVHKYLGDVYPEGNFLPEYLEEMYEHRVIATHPAGRFGEYWTPPLMVDDIYDLRKHLIVIFRHILLDERPQLKFEV
jgi:hypothetical protein